MKFEILKMQEQEEIEKILIELSEAVQEVAHDLFLLVAILSEIDVILAKAKYGTVNKYTKPEVNNEGIFVLHKRRIH